MEQLSHDELRALNAERLRQWGYTLTNAEASAIVVLGVGSSKTNPVTVLSPDGVEAADVIRLLLHAANTVALEWATN